MSSPFPDRPFAWIAGLMATFPSTWFVCGGWAVDAWLGRQTREHGDLDISVFSDDQRALFEHLAGWHLIAHGLDDPGATTEPWDGSRLDLPAHIHARPGGTDNLALLHAWVATPSGRARDGLDLEIMLNERSGDHWLFDADPPVSLPINLAIRPSPVGLPTAAPEVLMFFKATAYPGLEGYPRPADLADFLGLLPLLGPAQSDWLRRSVAAVSPRHPWLEHVRR